jgi:hypothetical protein
MRLSDIAGLVASHGAERFMRKRAGIVLPLAVGAMLPGIARRAVERASSTEHTMDRASGSKVAALPPRFALPLAQAMSSSGPIGRAGGALGGLAGNIGDQMLGYGLHSGKPSGMIGGLGQVGAAPLAGVASGISGGIGESIKRMLLGREFGERKDPMHLGGSAAISAFGKEMGTTGANLLRDIANKAMETASHAGDESARQAILGDLKRTDPVLASADDKVLMEAYHTMARFAPVLSTDKNAVRSFLRQAVMSGSGPDYMSIKLIADSERSVTDTGKDKR